MQVTSLWTDTDTAPAGVGAAVCATCDATADGRGLLPWVTRLQTIETRYRR